MPLVPGLLIVLLVAAVAVESGQLLFGLPLGWKVSAPGWSSGQAHLESVEQISFFVTDTLRKESCALYYKPGAIVNDNSRAINKLETLLIDNARVIIYDCHMFIVQATGAFALEKPLKASLIWPRANWLSGVSNVHHSGRLQTYTQMLGKPHKASERQTL